MHAIRTLLTLSAFLMISCDKANNNRSQHRYNTSPGQRHGQGEVANHNQVLRKKIDKIAIDSNVSMGEAAVLSYESETENLSSDREIETLASSHARYLAYEADQIAIAIKHSKFGPFRKALVDLVDGQCYKRDGSLMVYPLEDIYHSLPESEDRSKLAIAMVRAAYIVDEKVSSALTAINELKGNEDKSAALEAINTNVYRQIASKSITLDELNTLKEMIAKYHVNHYYAPMVDKAILEISNYNP